MPTIVLKSRVDRSNAAAARRVLTRLGLKPSDAINALFAQIASRKALPFSLATSDSSYAREEYGLDKKAIITVGKSLRKQIEQERLDRSEEHTSELQSPCNLLFPLLFLKKKKFFERTTHQSQKSPSTLPDNRNATR